VSVFGYVRVSTEEQGRSGLGLEAQSAAIRDEASRRGWDVDVRQEVRSGSRAGNRPELQAVLSELQRGDTLVVTKLDRLVRSATDFGKLLQLARRRGWDLIVLDLGIDMTTTMGKAMVQIVAVFAELERDMIADRIRDALAVKREQGDPRQVPNATREVIRELRATGLSERAIAARLNADEVPAVGSRWFRTTVRRVLEAA
jgi:DNA invertase Pin-like site-specific DNA recombinase